MMIEEELWNISKLQTELGIAKFCEWPCWVPVAGGEGLYVITDIAVDDASTALVLVKKLGRTPCPLRAYKLETFYKTFKHAEL
jgi:hypothetical protein